jgi:hypothetical protein
MKLMPIGIEGFKEMINKNYYYIDKTNLIAAILNEKVVFCTRPRRFGKTLNMSMLYYFFSIKEKDNAYLFDYLNISKNKNALKHQNNYPTIFISLKEMKNSTFDAQVSSFGDIIKNVILQNKELLESVYVDESDVPLQSAYQNNYYDEMVDFLRSVFSSALKTNDALEKGILTGCPRISKESIFTGLNNFKTYSLLDEMNEKYFDFNENEDKQLLEYYNLIDYIDEVKEWYDGYLFGNIEIYNPWSTLMYVDSKLDNVTNQPVSFGANTSGNDLVVSYIQNGSDELHEEFEQLIQGKSLEKYIKPELTYREMDQFIAFFYLQVI